MLLRQPACDLIAFLALVGHWDNVDRKTASSSELRAKARESLS